MKNNDRNKKIASIVELIMKEKNHNPRDSVFRFNEEYYPEEQHISLRFPGKFVKTVSTDVFTVNNRNFKMDSAHHVLPDEKLPYESLINPEHQHKQLTLEKKMHYMITNFS